jgi:NADPH:quinone reductase-like Zn-dependent oxidoreductase
LYGAEVTGVDNPGKLELMRSLGFDHVIDYIKEDFTETGKLYELILDVKTNRSAFDYIRALTPGGIYATVGGSTGRLIQVLLLGPLIKKIYKKNLRIVALRQNKDLTLMNELFKEGKVRPVINGSYKLTEIKKAFKLFGEGKHKGKVVITIDQE